MEEVSFYVADCVEPSIRGILAVENTFSQGELYALYAITHPPQRPRFPPTQAPAPRSQPKSGSPAKSKGEGRRSTCATSCESLSEKAPKKEKREGEEQVKPSINPSIEQEPATHSPVYRDTDRHTHTGGRLFVS
ncbi:hypothetical protein PF005_g22541 [Phytophthora fragariae]|uniref:Uncharacterized protein n=1 Tax=Phytophthora fragariae TaxID=53985 RepID=A0A6A3RYY1_9STRA|nr:hypothetical protein PF009_g23277 [Phytophthora fragariae]KAE8983614.1 hypothetical protein PF011_g21113 [Phytophthora fragariae]KAE9081726.1 hypothetical protein PF007_g22548 [Phytophthora fragariae]KAE9081940.1 hypothetical protein PF010_g21789 [Phytophthora fragariae]KAE9105973.1 hypothetical protein PF006_g21483 [Phytophthora fragariae]